MGTTPNYQWPLPEEADTPDVPRDMKDLGDAVDATVKANADDAAAKLLLRPRSFMGSTSVTIPASTRTGKVAVTFPANMFSKAPSVLVNANDGSTGAWGYAGTVTAIGCDIGATRSDQTGSAYTPTMSWVALSLDPAATATTRQSGRSTGCPCGDKPPSPAPPDPQPDLTCKLATCQNSACGNYQYAAPLWLSDGQAVQCGVCGQPITDITPAEGCD